MMKTPEQIIQEQVNPTKPRGGLGGLLDYAKTRNNDTGLSRMQNFAAALDPLILPEMRAGEGIRERGAQRVAAGNKNKTIEMLIARGREDLANLVKSGAITAQQAANVLLTPSKDNRIALQKRAELAGLVPGTPEYQTFMLQGGVSSGGAPAQFGSIPQGYQLVEGVDEAGNKSYSMQPVPGGPLDTTKSDIATLETKSTSGTTVLGDIQEMKRKVNENPSMTTGLVGSVLKKFGGTGALDVDQLGETIRANIGFDRLQRMRDESPTGGALGQVAVQELEALQASLGSLNTSQSSDQLLRNLERLENQYRQSMLKILNTEGGSNYFSEYEKSIILNNKEVPATSTVDFSTMTDEQLKQYIADNEGKKNE